MANASDLHKGARVSWNTSQGRTQGIVVRKAIRRFTIDDFEIAATKDDPRWVVKAKRPANVRAQGRRPAACSSRTSFRSASGPYWRQRFRC
jgi:hypothetical protein